MKKILLFAMMCLFGLFSTISAQNVISLDGADVKTETSNEVRSSSDHCYVNFTLYDGPSDGWHGGYLRVYFDNIYEDLIIDNGRYSQTFTLEIPRNSYVYVVFYEGSNWAEECSYEIAYEDGPIIHEASYDDNNMDFEFNVNCGSLEVPELTAVAENNTIVLSWNAVEDAEYYNVYGYDDKSYRYIIRTEVTNTTFVVENVDVDVKHCYSVTAVNDAIGESYASEMACAIIYEEGTKVIGEGDLTVSSLPTNAYYNYSLTQQIYTAEELGLGSSIINKIAFYQTSYNTDERQVEVYMMNTDKTDFVIQTNEDYTYSNDWVSVQETDKVFEGVWTIHNAWSEIELDNDFIYTGGNILLCVLDKTGSYNESTYFRGNDVLNYQSLRYYTDETELYVNNMYYNAEPSPSNSQIKIYSEPISVGECQIPELTAEALGYSDILLEWNYDENAAYYNVYGYGEEGYYKIASTTKTTYTVENLEHNTTYCFAVTAANYTYGESGYSNRACATTDIPRPEEPYIMVESVKENSVVLTWYPVDYAEYYNVYYNDYKIGTTKATTYTLADLDTDRTYCFTVTAVNEVGESSHSNMRCEEMSSEGSVIVGNYDDNISNLPISVYYNYSLTQQIYTAEELGLDAQCEIASIAFYQESYYENDRYLEVFMMNTDKDYFENEYDWVNMVDSVKVFEGDCTIGYGWVEIPLSTSFKYEGGNILLCVVDNSGYYDGDVSYRIYYTENTQTLRARTDYESYNPYNANGVYGDSGDSYKNQLKLRLAGESEGLELAAPVLAAEATSDSTILLSWDIVEGAESYTVYYDYFKIASTADTTYLVGGLDYGTDYCFTVKAVCDNAKSEHSNLGCERTLTYSIPSAPIVVGAEAEGPYQIVLQWNMVEFATHYNVYHDSKIVATAWTDTTCIVKGLKAQTEYCFNITAINKVGESMMSDTICAMTEKKTPCYAPENVKAKVKNSYTISLTWDEQSCADSYRVYRDGFFLADTEHAEYIDAELEPDTEYCYTVKSVCKYDKSKESEEICVETLPDGLEEKSTVFNIYPNPVNDKLYIETEVEVVKVVVYDVYGRIQNLRNSEIQNLSISVDVTSLNSGVYFVKVVTDNGEVVKRIVKK